MKPSATYVSVLLWAMSAGAACHGDGVGEEQGTGDDGIGTGEDDGGDSSGDELGQGPLCFNEDANQLGRRVLRRLTTGQFDTTVRAVFELDEADFRGAALPPNPAAENGFNNNADRLQVGSAFASNLLRAARSVGDTVSGDAWLSAHLDCAAVGGSDCAREFIERYGTRAYRRPLTSGEERRYLELFEQVEAAGHSFATWVGWATVGLLQSPNLLYRSELGEARDGQFELDDYEIATALAYTYSATTPTDELLEAAKTTGLRDPEVARQWAGKLALDDAGRPHPRFEARMLGFFEQWLGFSEVTTVAKDPQVYPGFSDRVAQSMLEETHSYLRHMVFENRASVAEIMTEPTTFVDDQLTHFYGFGPVTGTPGQFKSVERPEEWGVGLLAQGSWLSVYGVNDSTSPTQRGVQVRARIACEHLPPPDANIPELPDPREFNTTRERYEEGHANDDACAQCHRLTDPIGFAFEHMGSDGRYRPTENGYPIDSSGFMAARFPGEDDRAFDGLTELAHVLAESRKTSDCIASFMAGDVFGLNHDEAACTVGAARDELARSQGSLLDYYLDLSTTPRFFARE